MAAGVVDGALIIDTGIDNSGAIKGANELIKALNGLKQSIDAMGKNLGSTGRRYTQTMQQGAQSTRTATAEMQKLQQRVVELNREMFRMQRAGITDENREQYRALDEELRQVVSEMNELRRSGRAWEQTSTQATEAASGATSNLGSAFASVTRHAGNALRTIGQFIGNGAVGFLKRLASGAKNAAIQLAKLAGRAISGGLKKLESVIGTAAKRILGFDRASRKANTGMSLSLKNILKYGLGIRSLFVLFNRLRAAVKEGFGELRKSAPEVDKALKNLKTSLTGLKGSLATAFAPILTAIEPALTTLIDLLTRAINAIGAFMAALSGASFYYVANSVSNVANGVEDVGNAASNASGDVKALKRQLAGFDELNILSQSSGGGGGGGGGSGGGLTYTKTPIESGITDFVAQLKQMWADADYEGIGRSIAGAINRAFAAAKKLITSEDLEQRVATAVDAIAGIFNSLVDGIEWENVGSTIGGGINVIVSAINRLSSQINWESIGTGISSGLNGLIKTVDWDGVGAAFTAKINALIGVFAGAVSTFDWGEAGEAFATTVNSLLLSVKWSTLTKAFAESINGVISALTSAVTGFDWGEAGKTFATNVNLLLVSVKWTSLGKAIGESINGVLDWLYNAVSTFDWGEAGKAFADTVNSLLTTVNWSTLTKAFGISINGVVDALLSAIRGFDWGEAGKTFASNVNLLLTTVNWTNLGKAMGSAIQSVTDYLFNAAREFNWGEAGTAFAEAVNGLIDEIEPETISELIEGVFKGAIDWGEAFLQDFDEREFAIKIRTALEKVDWKAIASKLIALIKDAVESFGDILSIIMFGEDFTDEYEALYYPGTINIKPEAYKLVGSKIIPDEVQKDFEEALKTGNWNAFEVTVKTKFPAATADDVAIMYNTFINEWNKLHPEAKIDPALPKDAAEKVLEDWRNKNNTPLPATVDAEIDDQKWQQEIDAAFGHPFAAEADINAKPGNGLKKSGDGAFKLSGIDPSTVIVDGKPGDGFKGKLSGTNTYTLKGIEDATATVNGKPGNGFQSKTTRAGNYKLPGIADSKAKVNANIVKSWGKQTPQQYLGLTGLTAQIKAQLVPDPAKKSVKIQTGTIVGGMKYELQKLGGIFQNGLWSAIPQYAGGTINAHGSLFLAGEAGPEIVGHVGGRTEVLNKSQLASTMFAAVENGMLAAASRIEFHMPAMASGTVLPYDVSAQIAKTGQDIMTAMDANNEDLIQTIISVAGQIVNALGGLRAAPAVGGMTAQQVINALNQRTQMFGESPLQGG